LSPGCTVADFLGEAFQYKANWNDRIPLRQSPTIYWIWNIKSSVSIRTVAVLAIDPKNDKMKPKKASCPVDLLQKMV